MNQHQNQNQGGGHVYRIACLGTGYTAGVTMIIMAHHCVDVSITMLDVFNENIDQWLAGTIPFNEPGMNNMFANNDRLMFGYDHDIQAALLAADCIVIAIDNPIQRINKLDTLNLEKWRDTWEKVAIHAPPGKLVIEKSNLPLDGPEKIIQVFRENGVLHDPMVVYNPEFYSLGTASVDLQNPRQVIFGGNNQIINGPQFQAYRGLLDWVPNNVMFRYPDYKSVFLAKLGISALLASKISILNSIASISGVVKADMESIMEIMRRDERLGPTYLTPGIGFGGPSLERDTLLLGNVAETKGLLVEKQMYVKVIENNEAAGKRFVSMVVDKLIGITNITIAIFGIASKHRTSDLTKSPAMEICKMLLNHKVYLKIYDPHVPTAHILRNFRGRGTRVVVATSPLQAATNASAICILTDCNAYQHGAQFYNELFAVMTHPSHIFNGRRNLGINWQAVANTGFSIHAVGRPSIGLGFQ